VEIVQSDGPFTNCDYGEFYLKAVGPGLSSGALDIVSLRLLDPASGVGVPKQSVCRDGTPLGLADAGSAQRVCIDIDTPVYPKLFFLVVQATTEAGPVQSNISFTVFCDVDAGTDASDNMDANANGD